MSKKRKIYANQGAKYKDFFIGTGKTKTISEDLFIELKETRFFKDKILVEVKQEKKVEENKITKEK